MSASKRRGRRTVEEIKRAQILEKIEEIAYMYAPDAMDTIGLAASGTKVSREVLAAAQYIINQVLGRPAEKDLPDTATAAVKELIEDVIEARNSAAESAAAGARLTTYTQSQRVQPMVEEAADPLLPNG